MSLLRRRVLYDRDIFVIVAFRVAPTSSGFAKSKKRFALSSSRVQPRVDSQAGFKRA
jgi:hypothetical protein